MKKFEFYSALFAYLKGTANSWQEFILEDYYNSFEHCLDILDQYTAEKVARIGKRLRAGIEEEIRKS